jgi:hypothetical protein
MCREEALMSKRQHPPKIDKPDAGEAPWAVDQDSRQQSMAAHARETRTKMSVGQSNAMRLKRGNQPRHGGS